MDLSLIHFALSTLTVMFGAVLQAATGLGGSLLVVPLLALIDAKLIPGPVIFASLALSSIMAYRGRDRIRSGGLGSVLAGLATGTMLGVLSLSAIPLERAGLAFGMLVFSAVLISSLGLRVGLTPWNLLLAGAVSGFMGATAAIGAPVLALMYQHEDANTVRATLAFLYFVSSIAILVFFLTLGRFRAEELLLGAQLLPGFLLGYALAGPIARWLNGQYSRIAILALSTVSSLVLIGKSL